MRAKSEIDNTPPMPENYRFEVNLVVKGEDTINLGNHVILEIIDTPGHSQCHISAYEKTDSTLVEGEKDGNNAPISPLKRHSNNKRRSILFPTQRISCKIGRVYGKLSLY